MGLGSGHTMRKQGRCLEKEIIQRTIPGARSRGRPRSAWMDNITTWTGLPLPVEASISVEATGNKVASCFNVLLRQCCFDIVAGIDRT